METLTFSRKNLSYLPLAFIIANIETIIAAKSCEAMYTYTDFTFTSMGIGLLLVSLLVALLFSWFEKYQSGKYLVHYSAGLLLSVAVVSIFPHICYSIVLRQYLPGLVTSVLILPFLWFIFKKEIKPNFIEKTVKFSMCWGSVCLLIAYSICMYLSMCAVNSICFK